MPAALPRDTSEPAQTYLTRVYEGYLAEHGDSALGVAWTRPEQVPSRYEAMLDLIRFDRNRVNPEAAVDLIDVGCGAGHLYDHLRRYAQLPVNYSGIDTSPDFVSLCRQKFPGVGFEVMDLLTSAPPFATHDYAVANGVLTMKVDLDYDEMWDYAQRFLVRLFATARRGIAFNVMTKHLDWERDDLFHVPFDAMADFVRNNLSRHFAFRQDYGPYEYTTYVYREPTLGPVTD